MSTLNLGQIAQTGMHPVAHWMVWFGMTDRAHFVRKLRKLGLKPDPIMDMVDAEELMRAVRRLRDVQEE